MPLKIIISFKIKEYPLSSRQEIGLKSFVHFIKNRKNNNNNKIIRLELNGYIKYY